MKKKKKKEKRKEKKKAFQTSTPCIPIAGQEKSLIPLLKKKRGGGERRGCGADLVKLLSMHANSGANRQAQKRTHSCWLVGCLTSQQQASVSQGRICSDNFTCCHTETEVSDPTFYLTQSQYTDTGLTSPSADPITPGAWQGSHWSANF